MAAVSKRLAPALAGLAPYDPGFTPVDVLLSANENSHGVPASVRAAMDEAIAGTPFNRYPDPMANELRDAIAAWHGVKRGNVVAGNGGDELLFNILLAFGGEGRTLIDCPPTFSIYGLYAQLTRTNVVRIARDPETFAIDQDAVMQAAATADVVMLTTPNNPTGTLISKAWIEELAASTDALIVVDEAYIEFADPADTCISLIDRFENIAVLRTFSKAYGLAGMRSGYVIACEDVINGLAAVRQVYSTDVCSQAAARIAAERHEEYEPVIALIRSERDRLAQELAELGEGVRVWPSAANFLLVRVPNAHEVYGAMRDEFSILVRDFSRSADLSDCLRITVGTPEENDRVIAALKELTAR